ncbi:MAG: hypothetical protein ACXWLH_00325 [Candidatus Saccharimonadales bacterium]
MLITKRSTRRESYTFNPENGAEAFMYSTILGPLGSAFVRYKADVQKGYKKKLPVSGSKLRSYAYDLLCESIVKEHQEGNLPTDKQRAAGALPYSESIMRLAHTILVELGDIPRPEAEAVNNSDFDIMTPE